MKKRTGLLVAMLLAAYMAAEAAVFEGAHWLRDPVFDGVAVRELYRREDAPKIKASGPKNVHTLLRTEITLKAKPSEAVLAITGDDYYHFYLNGYGVVQGPEAGYAFCHPYYWLDVSEFLEAGENCLAAHLYYQGLINRVWNSGDNRSGFMLALDVVYEDGSKERFVSDASWKCFQLKAFPEGETIGYDTQFAENIDMRLIPKGWTHTGFDASVWGAPLLQRQDHQLMLQLTPPLQRSRRDPIISKDLGNGRYFYDFGMEIVGHTRIKIKGKAGEVIKVRHGEELDGEGQVRFKMRANCLYEEAPILSGEEETIAFYDYRAFRYLEILDAPAEPEVWVMVRHHPFEPEAAQLTSSDKALEDIWTICKNGVWMGCQGGFLDCPSREKGQYLGDAVITSRSHLWLTGDPSLTRKALWDFAQSRRIHEGIMAVAPGSLMQEIAEYSLQYPLVLKEFYRHSGDKAFMERMVDLVFEGLFGYFEKYENAAGLLEGIDEKWVLVDWPENLRDNYDYEYAELRANTVVNAFYYGSLLAAADLLDVLERDAAPYLAKAERVADAFAAHLSNPDTGLYLDAPGSTHSSLHANAIPLAFGLHRGADKAKMLALIEERGLSCGVYIASFVIEACFRNGAADLGYRLLTSDAEHSWREMIKHGATTCMEAWGPDQKWNTSWCHPWSSSPIYLIAEQVMGLQPGDPGWKSILVAPQHITGLPEISLQVPHPQGNIKAVYRPGKGYTVTVPAGVSVTVNAPEDLPVAIERTPTLVDAALSETAKALLQQHDWRATVGDSIGVLCAVPEQRLYLLQGDHLLWQTECATAEAGVGNEEDSFKTPLGWHRVAEKFGADAPWGQVFRSRKATGEIWQPGEATEEDLVLTRLLWLEGLEPGLNQGRNAAGITVDSKRRCIYMHGTNDEARIGSPSSHGCIRLRNDDIITAFDKIPQGAKVLIAQ